MSPRRHRTLLRVRAPSPRYALLLWLIGTSLALTPSIFAQGVVAFDVEPSSRAWQAGFRSGDLIESWRPLLAVDASFPPHGPIESKSHYFWLTQELDGRGAVEIQLERDGVQLRIEAPHKRWPTSVRPVLPAALEGDYAAAHALDLKYDERAIVLWQQLATRAEAAGLSLVAAELRLLVTRLALRLGRSDEAIQLARELIGKGSHPYVDIRLLDVVGEAEFRRGDLAAAKAATAEVIEIKRSLSPDGLSIAQSEIWLGWYEDNRGEHLAARRRFERALERIQRLAPGSAVESSAHIHLGNVLADLGDLEAAEQSYERAYEISKSIDPQSRPAVSALANLGIMAAERGRLSAAEERFRSVYRMSVELGYDWQYRAISLLNLGETLRKRGDLEAAEAELERGVAIAEEGGAGSMVMIGFLSNLGELASAQRDYGAALDYSRRVLALYRQQAPHSPEVAQALRNLGRVQQQLGHFAEAKSNLREAAAVLEKAAPESGDRSTTLLALGDLALEQKDLVAAEDYLSAALRLSQEVAPGNFQEAACHARLAELRQQQGALEAARGHSQKATVLFERLAPESSELAEALGIAAAIYGQAGKHRAATEAYARALDVLDAQLLKLGGGYTTVGRFRADFEGLYDAAIAHHLDAGSPELAFHLLERSRARSFLAVLAERDLLIERLPAELEAERRALASAYEGAQKRLSELSLDPDEPGLLESGLSELRRLQREREQLVARIRRASPQLAALQYPEPLTWSAARTRIDQDTAILSYWVGEDATWVFASTPNGLDARQLEIAPAELDQQIEFLHRSAEQVPLAGQAGAVQRQAVLQSAGLLYRALVAPVETALTSAERVLLIPDGPLHRLPFAALVRELDGSEPRFFIEWKPLHVAVSTTAYVELVKARRATHTPRGRQLAAFGDPIYPRRLAQTSPAAIDDVRLRSSVTRGLFDFESLPHSRREVERIGRLFEAQERELYLGAEATEEQAKSLHPQTRILHFATHGTINDEFPLNSALALTIPEVFSDERDNGLLQAWEIFESLRLEADLVVLSACETGLGTELPGEGLIGLVRAFHFAGARSVAASLWKVPDRATEELMVAFYRHLRGGDTKDQALRGAQIELIRSQRHAEVYYWAAFQLHGDWR